MMIMMMMIMMMMGKGGNEKYGGELTGYSVTIQTTQINSVK